MEMIGSALCVGSGAKDGPLIVLQDLEPVRDIGRMVLTRLQGQLKIGGQECCAQLGDQFFFGIAFIAPLLAAKVAIQA
jgi:hypothetical protein